MGFGGFVVYGKKGVTIYLDMGVLWAGLSGVCSAASAEEYRDRL